MNDKLDEDHWFDGAYCRMDYHDPDETTIGRPGVSWRLVAGSLGESLTGYCSATEDAVFAERFSDQIRVKVVKFKITEVS